MSNKAFVDTTILADVLLKKNDEKGKLGQKALDSFDETLLPVYAIKEFKAGVLNNLIYFHNILAEHKSMGIAMDRVYKLFYTPNLRNTCLEYIKNWYKSHKSTFGALANQYGDDADLDVYLAERMKVDLRKAIMKAWRSRRVVTSSVVCELPCYPEENPRVDNHGLFKRNGSKCREEPGCFIAIAMQDNLRSTRRLKEVSNQMLQKGENKKRSSSLSFILNHLNAPCNDKTCRNLGDAVFAFQAPDDAVILTTNDRDHKPLAEALGKKTITPKQIAERESES